MKRVIVNIESERVMVSSKDIIAVKLKNKNKFLIYTSNYIFVIKSKDSDLLCNYYAELSSKF